MRRLLAQTAVSTIGLAYTLPAHAHLITTRFGELYSGLLHPTTTILHLVPWIAVGLLSSFQEPRHARWVLAVFPIGVLAGNLFGSDASWSVTEQLCIGTFVVLGLGIALRVQLSFLSYLMLVGIVGLIHGAGNAAGDLGGSDALLYAMGVTLAAYVVVTLTAAPASMLASQMNWGHIAIRAGGSWIAAIGLIYLAFQLHGI